MDATSQVSMIMVKKIKSYDKNDIEKILKKDWPELPLITNFDYKEGTSVFDMGEYHVAIGAMPAPIPQQDLEYPINTAMQWNEAGKEISLHKNHYVVFVSKKNGSFVEVNMLLTKIVKSFSNFINAIGIYWGGSEQIISTKVFGIYCEIIKEKMYPIPIWVKITGYKNEDGSYYLYTVGLNEFNHKNIEIMNYKESFSNGYSFLLELSNYILSGEKVINDGDTVGLSEKQKIKVKYKKSELKKDEDVMSLFF